MRTLRASVPSVGRGISRFPRKKHLHMPGSLTPPGCPGTHADAPVHVAFRDPNSVGTQDIHIVAQWLAYAIPCRRFTSDLTASDARLGADAGRYSFIVVDFHHLLLAGLPAHSDSNFDVQSEKSSL
jgi:hypothetical protein